MVSTKCDKTNRIKNKKIMIMNKKIKFPGTMSVQSFPVGFFVYPYVCAIFKRQYRV